MKALHAFLLAGATACLGKHLACAQLTPPQLNLVHLGRNPAGSLTETGAGSYVLVGAGHDIWDLADECTFACHEVAGDFDVRVRVVAMQPTARWAKAGLMARESLAEDSRMVFARVAPPDVPTANGGIGINAVTFNYRTGNNKQSGENGGQHEDRYDASLTPQYPNAWIRLVRVGSVFTAYTGTDGVTWRPVADSQDTATWQGGAFAGKVYLGLAACRHSGPLLTCQVTFADYAETASRFGLAWADSEGGPRQVRALYTREMGWSALEATNYSLSAGRVTGVRPGRTPTEVFLDVEGSTVGSPLREGTNYTLTANAASVWDAQDHPLDPACASASFVHARGFETRRIHVLHNQIPGSSLDFFKASTAYRGGLPVATANRPAAETNALFEDVIPDGAADWFSTRLVGWLRPTATGNFRFACSSDDMGELYLSSHEQPLRKRLIAREPEWNSSRQYAAPDRRPGQINQSAPQALLAGRRYFLEFICAEGSGGNNGSVTWDAGTGNAFTNDQPPIGFTNFAVSRFAQGWLFGNLGPVQILRHPTNTDARVGDAAVFSVGLDGTPPYTFEWRTNGVPVAGAAEATFTISPVEEWMDGLLVSVCVANPCGHACSTNATLAVALNPWLRSATSRGNPRTLYLQFNRPMQLTGLFAVEPGVSVWGADYGRDASEILLWISPDLAPDTTPHTVTVQDAFSLDGLPLVPNPTSLSFVHGGEFPSFRVLYRRYRDTGWGFLNAFLTSPKYHHGQHDVQLADPTGFFEAPANVDDHYGATLCGFYVASQSGDYRFWMASDDEGATYLATDGNPAHRVPINREPAWANPRAYTDAGHDNNDNRGAPPVNGSAPIPLNAGQVVYLEGAFTDGMGGDHYACAVTINDPAPPANGTTPLAQGDFRPTRVSSNGCFFTTLGDVFIVQPPQDQTVHEGQRATFRVGADGTPAAATCYSYQWFRDGLPIPDATNADYTTPPVTAADDASPFTVQVTNDFSGVWSGPATLHVSLSPIVLDCSTRNDPSHIYVQWNKVVSLGGSYSVGGLGVRGWTYGPDFDAVVVETDPMQPDADYLLTIADVTDMQGHWQEPNPAACLVHQGPGRFTADFNHVLPANATLAGTAYIGPDGLLHLTDAATNQQGSLVVDLGRPHACFRADFKVFVGGGTSPAADGFSFCFGSDLAGSFGEEGTGSGLIVSFDTYENGGEGTPCVDVRWRGSHVAHAPVPLLTWPGSVDVSIELTASGHVTVKYGAVTVHNGVPIPGYTSLTNHARIGLGARTGALAANHWIDDLRFNDVALGPAQVTLTPGNGGLPECAVVTLVAAATGSPCLRYAWLSNGVPVPGATGPVFVTAPLRFPDNDGVQYTVVVSNGFSSAEATATFNLTPDAAPPQITSVGSLDGCVVGVTFTEAVDPATATEPGNYSVVGEPPGAAIVPPIVLRADGQSVLLSVAPCLTGSFTVQAAGVLDACPGRNATNSESTGFVAGLRSADVGVPGDPYPPGTNFASGPGSIEITTGGSDTWNNADHNHFVFAERCGDFDVAVQVTRLDFRNTWSKGGLMARFGLEATSPTVATYLTPTNGADQIEAGLRVTPGGSMIDWGSFRPTASGTPWIRLVRSGDRFLASHSADGTNWIDHADSGTTFAGLVPSKLLVGVFATPNANGYPTTARFEHFDLQPSGPVSVMVSPATVTATECRPVTFTSTATGQPCYSFQWWKGFQPIPGATQATYTTPPVQLADDWSVYTLRVSNEFSVASGFATLRVVPDTAGPRIVSVMGLFGTDIGVWFDELVDAFSAVDPFHYRIDGRPPGDGIAGVSLMPDGASVWLRLSRGVGRTFAVTAENVLDACTLRNLSADTRRGSVSLHALDVGVPGVDPALPGGRVVAGGPDTFEVVARGSDVGGQQDHMHFIYTDVCGDFDLTVKVERLDCTAPEAKAGLMARASLLDNDLALATWHTPASPCGTNQIQSGFRNGTGANMTDWTAFRPVASDFPWLRLQRIGNRFVASHSADGTTWQAHADTGVLPPNSLPRRFVVGLFATPNNGNNPAAPTTAGFREFRVARPAASQSYTLHIPGGRVSSIANHLDIGCNNTLSEVLPDVPNDTELYKWDAAAGNWVTAVFHDGWSLPDLTLGPGEAALVNAPTSFDVTFAGSRHTPVLPYPLGPGGIHLVSRQTLETGDIEGILGGPLPDFTEVFVWDQTNGCFGSGSMYFSGAWDTGSAPVVPVGGLAAISLPPPYGLGGALPCSPGSFIILEQPQSQTVDPGATVTLRVRACMPNPPTYQWRLNGVNIPGETNDTLALYGVQPPAGGRYRVAVICPGVVLQSEVAEVVVRSPPVDACDVFGTCSNLPSALQGMFSANNSAAMLQPGEPVILGKPGGRLVWFNWLAPADGAVTFSTRGSAFDTLLAVFAGDTLPSLSELASDEDSGGYGTSTLRFTAAQGETYRLALDGYAAAGGNIVLSWNLAPGPPLPRILAPPTNQVVPMGSNATFQAAVANASRVQWLFNGALVAGGTNPVLVVSEVGPARVGYYVLQAFNAAGQGVTTQPAWLEIGPFAGVFTVDKFEERLNGAAPNRLGGGRGGWGRQGLITVSAGTLGSQILNNTNSTTQAEETNHCGVLSGATRWFLLNTTNADLTFAVDTVGSSIDTILAAYLGDAWESLTNIACARGPGSETRIMFPALPNTNYAIAVDGTNRTQGIIRLNWGLGSVPVIESQPVSVAARVGETVAFSVRASGVPAPAFQWRSNNFDVPGATGATLVIPNVTTSAVYQVVVSNFMGVVLGAPVRLSVGDPIDVGWERFRTNQQWGLRLTHIGPAHPWARNYFVVAATTNLSNWTAIWTNLIPVPTTNFFDADRTNFSRRFYRLEPYPTP